MNEYLKLLKRKLERAEEQIQKRSSVPDMNNEGFKMLGFYQGRVSILEDAIDEIEYNLTHCT